MLTATVARTPEHRARTLRTKSPAPCTGRPRYRGFPLAEVGEFLQGDPDLQLHNPIEACTPSGRLATWNSHQHRVRCTCAKYHHVLTRQRVPLRFREASATRGLRQDEMNKAEQSGVFVDANNVMGSRPDGWCRDRADAARRFVAEITPQALGYGDVWTLVFDGQVPSDMASSPECVPVVHTGHGRRDGADDRIVELVHALPDRATSLVYTSDAKLRTRVHALGARAAGTRELLSEIATVRGTIEPSATGRSLHPADGAGRHHRLNAVLPTTITPKPRIASDCDEPRRQN